MEKKVRIYYPLCKQVTLAPKHAANSQKSDEKMRPSGTKFYLNCYKCLADMLLEGTQVQQ